ncbi:MAG: protein-glutamate O-methyltransferase CheR [Cytophagales bacterium]|nr:protein-glutamate O-methyltransferase CheR [Bernardetiaceae bacterium]MDW8209503.1 protein-glutamate O-methyltransferase CheR [Cytophagales bacterium]
MSTELDIEIADIRRLTELIKDKYGYDFRDYAMSSFRRRIKRVIELYKFKTVDKLIQVLDTTPSFFEEFISEITVNVTEMFRDPTFWRVLKEQIIPNIIMNHDRISIWHAGCSSGEEVLSMVILLYEMGFLDKAKITATDIDTAIINKAKTATIAQKNMELNQKNYQAAFGVEGAPPPNLRKYFRDVGQEAVFDKSLLQNVTYRKHDLVQGPVFSKFDLVLCRNVMIYFNQNLQNAVLAKLHESLFKYGYLAIGSKESLIWCDIANKFIVVNNEEKIYKKIKD